YVLFFFSSRRRHTRSKRDWSSDVCSSDLSATWWSAFAFLGSNASFYVEGPVYLTAFAWNILFGYLYFVVGKRIWFLGKKFNYVTPSDLLGDFYNNEKVRIIVGLIVIIFKIFFVYFLLLCGSC